MTRIAVCIASFNRKERTISCISRLYDSDLDDEAQLTIHLLDDNSSDGTFEAVASRFPGVSLHIGDGNSFWAGGMRIAYGAALAEGHDYYVWLNDDVELFPSSITRAIETERERRATLGGKHLIVGAMCAGDLKTTTYSGFVRSSRLLPWKLQRITPDHDKVAECDTVNGNFVLIPGDLASDIGNIDPALVHMHADLILGFKARREGARNWIMPGYAGICDANSEGRKKWDLPALSLKERLKLMEHPLGYPLRSNVAYSKYFGLWAPLMIIAPYITMIKNHIISQIKTNRQRSARN